MNKNALSAPAKKALLYGLVIFLFIAVCVVVFTSTMLKGNRAVLDANLTSIVRLASSLIDVEAHNQLRSPDQTNGPLYNQTLAPLVKLHNAFSSFQYVYTLIERDGRQFFILDTANSPDLKTNYELESSLVMEEYHDPTDTGWLATVKRGDIYIDSDFFEDDFGTFISASAPLLNADGSFAGIVGVDMNADAYTENRRYLIMGAVVTLVVGVIFSLLLGVWIRNHYRALETFQAQQRLQSLTDPLTGAWNRRYFDVDSMALWHKFVRYGNAFSIALLDIDHFKKINDTHGHAAGDACLIAFVRTIKSVLRECDYVVRMGGDEFLVVMPETDSAGARQCFERIARAVDNLADPHAGCESHFTASIGVSQSQTADRSVNDVLKRADTALYKAKTSGRNCVVVES